MSDTGDSVPGRISAIRPLDGMASALLVHTVHRPKKGDAHAGVDAVRQLLDHDGVGVVYAMPRGQERWRMAMACVDQTRLRSPGADIVLDATLYTGANRKAAGRGIEPSWLTQQHRAGLIWALTDSGYIGKGDHAGLRTILEQAAEEHRRAQARNRGVLAALPLAGAWLAEDADILTRAIREVGTPVALMLEAKNDPLSVDHAVSGLVSVLDTEVPVAVLRCDMSTLGALAYGAVAVAVGDSSALRHFYPNDAGGGGRRAKLATLVPELLAYNHVDKIENAITAAPGLTVWLCGCRVCGGRRLDWISNSDHPDVDAFEHAVSALAMIGRRLFSDLRDGAARRRSWYLATKDAELSRDSVLAHSREGWDRSLAVDQWIRYYERTNPPTSVLD